MKDLVIVSGYFNPLHIGHLDYIESAKSYAKNLIAIVNNDEQVSLKGSVPFMPAKDRLRIVSHLRAVDAAILSVDTTPSVNETIRKIVKMNQGQKIIFATGADHTQENTKAETLLCESLGIDIVYGVGGNKVQSSSKLLENVK